MFCPPMALGALEHFGIDVVVDEVEVVVVGEADSVPDLNGEVLVVDPLLCKVGALPMVVGGEPMVVGELTGKFGLTINTVVDDVVVI